jgi:hypothetical protein
MNGRACKCNHKCSQIEAVLQKLDLVQTNTLIRFSCHTELVTTGNARKT